MEESLHDGLVCRALDGRNACLTQRARADRTIFPPKQESRCGKSRRGVEVAVWSQDEVSWGWPSWSKQRVLERRASSSEREKKTRASDHHGRPRECALRSEPHPKTRLASHLRPQTPPPPPPPRPVCRTFIFTYNFVVTGHVQFRFHVHLHSPHLTSSHLLLLLIAPGQCGCDISSALSLPLTRCLISFPIQPSPPVFLPTPAAMFSYLLCPSLFFILVCFLLCPLSLLGRLPRNAANSKVPARGIDRH